MTKNELMELAVIELRKCSGYPKVGAVKTHLLCDVIDSDTPEDVYWLLKDLRDQVASLTPIQIRMMRDVLQLCVARGEVKREAVRRLKRRDRQEAEM